MSASVTNQFISRSCGESASEYSTTTAPRLRFGLRHATALGIWSLLAFTPAIVKSLPLPQAEPIGDNRLRIQLVAPKEPVRAPGSTLDVGTVEDGFDRASLIAARRADYGFTPVVMESWPEYEEAAEPVRVYRSDHPVELVLPEAPRLVLNAEDRSFGFGEKLPDFAAERQARQVLYETESGASETFR